VGILSLKAHSLDSPRVNEKLTWHMCNDEAEEFFFFLSTNARDQSFADQATCSTGGS